MVAAALCLLLPASIHAAPTPAGTNIANTATLRYDVAGIAQTLSSNTVTLTASEIVDVTVTADRESVTVMNGDTVAVGYVVTNTGNGAEEYALTAAGDQGTPAALRLATDADGDGRYDPANDPDLSATAPAFSLAAGQGRRVFVLVAGSAVDRATHISLMASARVGTGAPGTVVPAAGADRVDVVIGRTGASASAQTLLTPSTGTQPTLVKSQTVVAPDGSSRAVHGAIITYSLVASFPTGAHGAALDDPIPDGTVYVPGSLTLDARALTDAADDDAGDSDAARIHVTLGDAAAAATRTVQFSVKIQ